MSYANFIPKLWAAAIKRNKDDKLYMKDLVNRDYEGEILREGDTVYIHQMGDVTVIAYTKYGSLGARQQLTNTRDTLLIDQAKAFNVTIDDIDNAQSKPKLMDKIAKRAGVALAQDEEDFIISDMVLNVDAGNKLGATLTPIVLDAASKAYDLLVDMNVLLVESNTDDTDPWWAVIPAFMHGLLLKDDRFVKSGTEKGDNIRMTGLVGAAAGFMIHVSNRLAGSGELAPGQFYAITGANEAYTFAQQLSKLVAYSPEDSFEEALKGLNLYGGELLFTDSIAVAVVSAS